MSTPTDPADLVLSRLDVRGRSGSGWAARCPDHDDHGPSLTVHRGTDGRP